MALAGAVDMLSWIRLFWAWMCDQGCDWRSADETLLRLPPAFSALNPDDDESETPMSTTFGEKPKEISQKRQGIITTTDCKSLFDLINNISCKDLIAS